MCIAVYETFEGKNCVSFYSSRDCRHWQFESRSFDLFECPDLFRLTVSETGERLWVLYGAESVYRVGHFENYRFTAIEGGEYLDYGEDTYAGQTFNDGPDETEQMHLSYLRDHEMAVGDHHDCGFSQSLSVMCRFTLHKTAAGYRLYRTPIEALDTLRRVEEARDYHFALTAAPQEGLRVTQTVRLPLPTPSDCVLTLTGKEDVSMNIMGKGLVYHPATHTFEFAGGKHYTLTRPENLVGDSVEIRILTDRRSVEYFIGDEISATYSIGTEQKELLLDGSDTTVDCRLYPCKPIF